MTDPELGKSEGDEVGSGDVLNADNEKDFNDHDASKAHLLINANGNGGAGPDPAEVKILDGPASSEGEVSFNGLSKDEVMKYADEPFWKRLRLILFILFWIGWTAMLGTAIVIIALAPRCPPRADLKWYQKETVYQVVPKSFKDSTGDGKGDFKGLLEKMDYIEGLGSKVVWLNNFYERDDGNEYMGRSVINHLKIMESFGATEAELKNWIKNMNKEGKKVLVDLIPNHTSKKHEWFMKSVKKEGKYANYYMWKDDKPNDWLNVEGGAAWHKHAERKQFYYEAFPGLPDLNLTNTDVQDEIMKIARFWLDAGVGGLHINDVQYLFEDFTKQGVEGQRDAPGTFTFLEKLRSLVDSYNKPSRERFIFAEVSDISRNTTKKYWKCLHEGTPRLNIVVPVMHNLKKDNDAAAVRDSVDQMLIDTEKDASPFWLGLALSDRHSSRMASRMQGSTPHIHVAHALQLLLPGTPFNYYGDEFGQQNGLGTSKEEMFYAPMQWNTQENAGFTKGKAWQKVSGAEISAAAATAHFRGQSPLTCFKDMVELRKEESFQWGKTKFCAPDSELLMFSRAAVRFPSFAVLMNLGNETRTVSLAKHHKDNCLLSAPEGTVRFHSSSNQHVGEVYDFHEKPATLMPGDVVVIEFPSQD